MKQEVFERQKAFAGEKKPSMQRRCVGHDYTGRQMYMLTMVVEGRRPLFGSVAGRADAEGGSPDAPRMELSPLGQRVADEWYGIPRYYPQVEVVALQMMPDHLHGILFVREQMDCDLSRLVRGFKTGCNRAYRELYPRAGVPYVATQSQQTEPGAATQSQQTEPRAATQAQQTEPRAGSGSHSRHGLLFAPGYNDRLLLHAGQLERWKAYLRDNPRRLLMKREHPEFFRVQRNVVVGGQPFSAIGNRFLLQHPQRVQVQCSRSLSEDGIARAVGRFLALARGGAVLVSPSISPGEKRVMRAAFDAGLPVIVLQENGFTDLAKPGGRRMDACARGQLLLLAPWAHHNERVTISRGQCLSLNDMARMICEQ